MIRQCFVLALCAACSITAWRTYAQENVVALETAYIFNFTQFTQWPAERMRKGDLRVCASARSPLRQALAALKGRAVGVRIWNFVSFSDSRPADCDVIFFGKGDEASGDLRTAFASDEAVLIISEDGPNLPGEAVIKLIQDDDHLRFDINNGEAVRRKLVLSSKLLRLARRIR
jgi:L-alanine-DL-glutamate epimerase-like enolase superfamily enzyme